MELHVTWPDGQTSLQPLQSLRDLDRWLGHYALSGDLDLATADDGFVLTISADRPPTLRPAP